MSTTRRSVTLHDLLRFQMADDPQVSPDGRSVAWVRTEMLAEENRYRSTIGITDLASGATLDLVEGTHPRWSPDGGRLAYLAPDPGATPLAGPPSAETFLDRMAQLWVRPIGGGEATRLTDLRGGAGEPAWSPDGERLAFTTLVHPERGPERGDSAVSDDPYERFNRDVLVVTRVRWKSDALGLLGDYVRQLATVRADGSESARVVTRGPQPLVSPTWSPDGSRLAASGNLGANADAERRQAVYLVDPAADGGAPLALWWLAEMRGADLAWSPDGTRIAVCGHDDGAKGHYGFQRLWLVDVASGTGECVSAAHDVSLGDYSRNQDMRRYGGPDGPRWLPGGDGLLVLTNERGTVNLARFDLATRTLASVTEGDHSVCAFTLARDGTVAYVQGDHVTPGDVWTVRLDDPRPRRVSDVNAALRGEVALVEPERFVATGSGVEVEGWVLLPPNLAAGERCPVVLYTGGGPGGMRASVFTHEWQLYAAHGYAVINCNARGNYGYGEAFSLATKGAWGDLDYQDNMAFLREAIAAYPVIDGERLAVAGGSYGGYMASWITARHPEFKASVVDRCLFNRYAFGGTSDIGILLDHIEFDGKNPWEAPDAYLKWSPISYVDGIRTPTLVVHSALDYRCPIDQGEQLYSALRLMGVPTELVRFPDETHELSRAGRPWHRVFRLERYLEWFGRYL
jgi:dipeptidyl aminopeptidase/acylaminoacyl peptidase